MEKRYQKDKEFLEKFLPLTELKAGERKILLSSALQGRVLTSTLAGNEGNSFGWLNYELIESGRLLPHCNNWGGEDRFWLGPEGGQFSLFFPSGTDFAFTDWQTPAVIDTESWELVSSSDTAAVFAKETELVNCSGVRLHLRLDRRVSLAEPPCRPEGVEYVAFTSENKITNTGTTAWDKKSGAPSIWILGQFIPSPDNTILIPFRPSEKTEINDSYFGKIGDDRLKTSGQILFFKADGKKRGKIGIPPEMALPVAGAYDRENNLLTVVYFSVNETGEYVNSMWKHQEHPFQGDVINAYNDGPLEDGSIMGPFYELESSSPAAFLRPGESLLHTHTTVHYKGSREGIEKVMRELFGEESLELLKQ